MNKKLFTTVKNFVADAITNIFAIAFVVMMCCLTSVSVIAILCLAFDIYFDIESAFLMSAVISLLGITVKVLAEVVTDRVAERNARINKK
ncbi:hypothetical protein J6A31_05950 [bacterium]|nr:hypothetical protein [bacterium]